MWHIRDSQGQILALAQARFWPWLRPDSSIGLQVKILKTSQVVSSSLGTPRTPPCPRCRTHPAPTTYSSAVTGPPEGGMARERESERERERERDSERECSEHPGHVAFRDVLSSECGAHKTVRTILWSWLSGECNVFPLRSAPHEYSRAHDADSAEHPRQARQQRLVRLRVGFHVQANVAHTRQSGPYSDKCYKIF